MSESPLFKERMNAEVVRYYAEGLQPHLNAEAFTTAALDGLEYFELKARVKQIAGALRAHLDPDYTVAIGHLLALLRAQGSERLYEFRHWPTALFVGEYGVDHPEISLAAMKEITVHFSCEFAVRPFLVHHPGLAIPEMHRWAEDPDVHVRRNASEGMRPRLPWGAQLKGFIQDPEPVIAVLEKLRQDPEEYVRRSVANCLNDIGKDHPERLMDLLAAWDQDPDANSRWIKNRALRSLIKAGDSRALELMGFGPPQIVVEGPHLDRAQAAVGQQIGFTFSITSTAAEPQDLAVDYRVHFVKANGERRPKVFKLKTLTLGPGEAVEITRRQHLKPISTRRYHPGVHRVDVQINGQTYGGADFDLSL